MNIIIDARMVNEHLSGIGRYTFEIIKNIYSMDDVKIKLLVNDTILAKNIFGEFSNINFLKIKSKWLSISEQFELPLILNKYKKDHIFHSPSYVSSPFIKCKTIMTIHDLNHLEFPQFYTWFHKYYYKFIVKPSALKSKTIITDSNFSKGEILNWLKCKENKIIVTYCGVDSNFKVIEDSDLLLYVKNKYKLPDEFILYIGNQKPHKNIKKLIEATSLLKSNVQLIINGKPNEVLTEQIEKSKVQNRVSFIGYVEDEDLPVLYNLAKVFVFPSLYEGFGLPPLEAMACGCPVVTSNTSSLPEVVSNIGDMVNPNNAFEIAKAIDENIKIDKENYKKSAVEHALKFKWSYTAEKTYKIYKYIDNI